MSLPDRIAIGRSADSFRVSSPGAMRAHLRQRLRVCELTPLAVGIALRDEHAVRRVLGPVLQALRQLVGIVAELLRERR